MLRWCVNSGRWNVSARVLVAIGGLLFFGADGILAEPAVRRTFDGPETAWQVFNNGVPVQISAHDCVPGGAHDKAGCERIALVAPAGQSALLVCPTAHVAVLDELSVRLWVKASRPDLQLAARVVLPRSVDAQTRAAATAVVRGTAYKRTAQWQELSLADVPRLLEEQIRVMRATPGAVIDPHEAYVDAVVLIVPGDSNGVELGTDNLEVDGVVIPDIGKAAALGKQVSLSSGSKHPKQGLHGAGSAKPQAAIPAAASAVVAPSPKSSAKLEGTTLMVDGRQFFPRVVQWNGESLQFLANCGFNVVQLPAAPTSEQSAEAERLGLWFLCTPARPDAIERNGVGRAGDRVLAWLLQDEALEVDSNYAMRWAEVVRERDAVFGRPVVIAPVSNWTGTRTAADALVAWQPRRPSLTSAQFDNWLDECPKRALPGMPVWIGLSTQFDDAYRQQIAALTHSSAAALPVPSQQIESYVRLACVHGARGFVFQSTSSLSASDEPSRRRAAMLQLVNRRLQLIEPWLAGGKAVERTFSVDLSEVAFSMNVDRARLLVVLPNGRGPAVKPTRAPAEPSAKEIVFTVPGVPESSGVFYLSPGAMRTLPTERVAGGTKISLPGQGDGFVLITEDWQVIQSLRQRLARDSKSTVQLERELAVQRSRKLADTAARLAQLGTNADAVTKNVAAINQQITHVDGLIAAGQLGPAHDGLAVVLRSLDRAEGDQRKAIIGAAPFDSTPLSASSDTLVEYVTMQRSMESLRGGDNLLIGGDFEDLALMTRAGWQHTAGASADVQTSAQLSAVGQQQGRYCLELRAAGDEAKHVEDAQKLFWIESPGVAVNPSQLIEITGWVRVDRPFANGAGLEIADSIGGPSLAILVGQTSDWQPFRMIRASAEPAQLRLRFALTGIGSAKIDGVMLRVLQQPVARRLPPAQPVRMSTATKAAGAGGSLFAMPPAR
jgi:hypothetical protein